MKEFKKIKTEIQHKNPYWEYRVDDFTFPDGRDGKYYYVFTHGSTFIIPILEDLRIVMIEQHRYLNGKISLEFPGGGQIETITPEENAIKELREETGYRTKHIEEIGVFNPYNGVTSEIAKIFIATDLVPGETDFDDTEDIIVKPKSVNEINQLIHENQIWDGMTLAAWSMFERTSFYKENYD